MTVCLVILIPPQSETTVDSSPPRWLLIPALNYQ